MARLGRSYPGNRVSATRFLPVTFDAVGAGNHGSGNITTTSWSHTIGPNATAIVIGVSTYTSSSSVTITGTVGTASMVSLGTVNNYYNDGTANCSVMLLGVIGPPRGAQTVTISGNNPFVGGGNSVSYRNVARFGAAATNNGTAASATLSITSGPAQMVANVLADYTTTWSAYNQASRWNQAQVGASILSILLGDAVGTSSVSFSATTTAGPGWGAVGVPMLPVLAPA